MYDEEVNEALRVQWTTTHARLERWTEEVELLQEEMRRVVAFLKWKSGDWWTKQDVRSATTSSDIQSGLQAYARKQAAIHHDLAVSFSRLWLPTFNSSGLDSSWITEFLKQHKFPPPDTAIDPTTQVHGTFETGVLGEMDGSSSSVSTTPQVQHQDPPDATMVSNIILLKESTHVEDPDSDGSDDNSDIFNPSESDCGDDDSDFDFGWD